MNNRLLVGYGQEDIDVECNPVLNLCLPETEDVEWIENQ